jgi:tetratricopeptide (TPR) repeat protein
MTFFGILRDSPMAMMFVLVSLLNVFYGWRVFRGVGQGWADLNREPLRRDQKQLIDRAAFFLGIPLGVIIHELFHALTVWLFGGQVVDVGYGLYWGYVSHIGYYTPTQLWIIAMAGTIGSLAYGVIMWLIFRRIRLSTYRYFALRVLRVHLFYSLVFYPLFTLFTFVGDWKTIYDFNATPLLSGITLVTHLSILGLFYYSDRQGIFDMPGFDTVQDQAEFESLKSQAARSPHDAQMQLRLVDAYRRSGAEHLATRQLKSYLKASPNSAEGYLQLALLQAQSKRQIPAKAKDNAQKALSLGLSDPISVAQANRIAGEYSLNVGRYDQALERFNQGIAAARSSGRPEISAHLHYLRAMTYRHQQNYDLAHHDIQEAIKLARGTGQGALVSHYEAELATIVSHSGRSFGAPPPQ